MNIRVLAPTDIDTQKWDSCVHYAVNGNIFGYSWYLNNVGAEWLALVEGDYTSVMPVFLNTKGWWQKKETIQTPLLVRDTGPYTTSVLSANRLKKFIETIKTMSYPVEKISFSGFLPVQSFGNIPVITQEQKALLLVQGYEKLVANYEKGFSDNIQEQSKHLLTISNLRPEKFAEFYVKNTPALGEKQKHAVMRLCYQVLHRGWGFFSGIESPAKNLIAAGFFVVQANKGILLFGAQNKLGKKNGALPYMLNRYVQTNAGKPVLLDFNLDLSGVNPEMATLFGAEAFYTVHWRA